MVVAGMLTGCISPTGAPLTNGTLLMIGLGPYCRNEAMNLFALSEDNVHVGASRMSAGLYVVDGVLRGGRAGTFTCYFDSGGRFLHVA